LRPLRLFAANILSLLINRQHKTTMSHYDLTLKSFASFAPYSGHFFGHFLSTGNVTEKIAPPSGLFSAKIFPPWASMIDLHMESPRPIPVDFVVWKGENIASIVSGGMPLPESEIDTTILFEFTGLVDMAIVRASTG
jgi:hypothetical protein